MNGPVRRKVLVVDDDLNILDLLAVILEENGFHVDQARNGREALELVAQCRPDVLVLDLMMPVLDGWGVARALRADPATSSLPILVVSAARNVEAEARQLGASGWITKPFDLEELLYALRGLLGSSMPSGT